ncbi:hypothetical protein RAS1_13640 [Phycisphaerae bacterium RAS1]|nr:hypothetical protein RAS1_13640 [Phycisphaerae bacterium RAS1]
MSTDESILDDLFHGCALAAFVERAIVEKGWPDPKATNALACRIYEVELAARNRRKP